MPLLTQSSLFLVPEQLLVDTIASFQESHGELIQLQEVLELLTKIHDILDNAVSKWLGNSGHFGIFF